ncbi:MAG TPA: cell wall hydrolase [Desulfosporosinus sp.]|nr:cell wall hydrolase [Desulfosporosinus sp.]
MCLFLWQAGIYPVLGQGSDKGTWLPYSVAKEDTKKINNVNDNALENTVGISKIVVQRGETLWALAQTYRTTVDELVKLNQAKSANQIREGEPLWVPNVQPSESKIITYEIFVNQDNTSLIDKNSKSTSGGKDDAQKLVAPKLVAPKSEAPKSVAQKTVVQKPISAQKPESTGIETQVLSRSLGRLVSKEDVELLTRVIYGEARGEDFEGQVAVGAVVLNRLKDPRFPKSMRAIVYQSGAFTAVDDRQIHLDPDEQAYKAAEAALSGVDPTNGAIYYYNPRIATDNWIKTRTVIKRIGNHTFSI